MKYFRIKYKRKIGQITKIAFVYVQFYYQNYHTRNWGVKYMSKQKDINIKKNFKMKIHPKIPKHKKENKRKNEKAVHILRVKQFIRLSKTIELISESYTLMHN